MDTTKRNEEIYNRRRNGEKYKDIAESYGISKVRVREIYLKEFYKRDYKGFLEYKNLLEYKRCGGYKHE